RCGSGDHIPASARDALAEAHAEGPGGIVGCESDPLIGELDNLAPGARSTVRGLASMLAVRGNGSADPTIEIAERIARELQMGPSADVRAAALLRGVGSLAVPESILDKPGELDAVEWGLIRRRPDVAATLLRSLAGLDEVASIVRHEYERWDGTGYPDGLAGEQIPLGSRVLLASGAYFAMTSPRPWRRTLTHSEAVRQLSDNAGGQFDPEVVAVLIGRLHWMRQLGSAR
ncbi:MAG: HD-GYP domain-containing protein, partial [Solirubrobacterales bacterium]